MGSEVVRAVFDAPGVETVAALDVGDDLRVLVDEGAHVVVDFTHPESVLDNLEFAIGAGIHTVVGTTGFDEQRLASAA